jgi:methylated-DNA-protein-cysteine methyltransferase related protein
MAAIYIGPDPSGVVEMTGWGEVARHRKRFSDAFLPAAAGNARAHRRGRPVDSPAIQTLWDAIAAIPPGRASTYGAVARAAGLPGRARLTGLALRIAPPDMHLPWHRVVAAGGRIAFPKTSRQHREQTRLLRAEGILVSNGRVARAFLPDDDAP